MSLCGLMVGFSVNRIIARCLFFRSVFWNVNITGSCQDLAKPIRTTSPQLQLRLKLLPPTIIIGTPPFTSSTKQLDLSNIAIHDVPSNRPSSLLRRQPTNPQPRPTPPTIPRTRPQLHALVAETLPKGRRGSRDPVPPDTLRLRSRGPRRRSRPPQ